MKKVAMFLVLILSTNAFAYGHGGRHRHDRYSREVKKEVIIKHERRDLDWVGPALILGTTIAILSRPHVREKVVYVERTPEPRYETKRISEELSGSRFHSFYRAEESWRESCSNWKNEIYERFNNAQVSCGFMSCVRNGTISCSSNASAEVTYRLN